MERRQLPSRRAHRLRGRGGPPAVRQAELPPDQDPLNDDGDSDVTSDEDGDVNLKQTISFLPFLSPMIFLNRSQRV